MRPESPRVTEIPRNAMVCDMPYLQNEFGDPRFFLKYVFNLILSFSSCSQRFKKICTWELLGANVLKVLTYCYICSLIVVIENFYNLSGCLVGPKKMCLTPSQ